MSYIFVLFSCFLFHHVEAQKKVLYDSSVIEVRHLPFSQIKAYSEQKDFDYREQQSGTVTLWDRFWRWFWEQFYRLSQKTSIRKGFEIFIWVFSFSLILFAIYRITGMERRFFLRGNGNKRPLSYQEEQIDVHTIDFSRSIQEAIEAQQYRVAIRLMYLKNIKVLSDRNLIEFKPNKTNFDYARELRPSPFGKGFEETTLVYEYAWYGEFPVEKEVFERLQIIFSDYEKNIRS